MKSDNKETQNLSSNEDFNKDYMNCKMVELIHWCLYVNQNLSDLEYHQNTTLTLVSLSFGLSYF